MAEISVQTTVSFVAHNGGLVEFQLGEGKINFRVEDEYGTPVSIDLAIEDLDSLANATRTAQGLAAKQEG